MRKWKLEGDDDREVASINIPSEVQSIAIDSHAKYVSVGCTDGIVRRFLFSMAEDTEIVNLWKHKERVECVAMMKNDSAVISCSSDKNIVVWDIAIGDSLKAQSEPITSQQSAAVTTFIADAHKQSVKSLALFPDNDTLLSASVDGQVKMWSLKDGKHLKSFNGHSARVNHVAVHPHPKSRFFASASWDGTWKLWDKITGKCLFTGRNHLNSHVLKVVFSIDGNYIISSADNLSIHSTYIGGHLNHLPCSVHHMLGEAQRIFAHTC